MDRSETRRAVLATYPAMLAFFRARLGRARAEQAEDLAQETMVAALNAILSNGAIEDPGTYVLGIARRKLADLIRDGYRRPTVPLRVRSDETIQAAILKASAELRLVEREQTARLATAMQDLDARERDVLWLRYGEGLGNAEVAARIGLPAEETSRIKYRGLEKLRKILRGDPP